jgi:hypothetical protein
MYYTCDNFRHNSSYTVSYSRAVTKLSPLAIDFIFQRAKFGLNEESVGVMVDQMAQGSAPSNSVFSVNKIQPNIYATNATNGL